jgi:hypothetical protein
MVHLSDEWEPRSRRKKELMSTYFQDRKPDAALVEAFVKNKRILM